MVVAQESRAARIGVEILDRGGNAVDAAVAVGFALAVTYPRAGNLGGGGFMVIHLAKDNRDMAIDYRETAPAAATPTMFLDAKGNPDPAKSRDTALAVGVPGTVAGLALAQQKYGSGKLSLAELIAPAIELAREGLPGRRRHRRLAAARASAAGALAVVGERFSSTAASRCTKATGCCSSISPIPCRRSRKTGRAPSTRAASPARSPPPCAAPAAS